MDDVLKLIKVTAEGGVVTLILLVVTACIILVWKYVGQPLLTQHGELMRAGATTLEMAKAAAASSHQAAAASREAAERSCEAADRNRETVELLKQETVRLSALCQSGRKS